MSSTSRAQIEIRALFWVKARYNHNCFLYHLARLVVTGEIVNRTNDTHVSFVRRPVQPFLSWLGITMLAPDDRIETTRVLAETLLADGEYHQTIDSTNNRAKALAGSGQIRLPYLVLAEEQTAGRGRALKRWWTGRGSLAFSVILPLTHDDISSSMLPENVLPPRPQRLLSEDSIRFLGLAGALAVYRSASRLVPSHVALGIHWPNDVYANDRKLAGILVEVTHNRRAVVGIGVNVNNRSEDAPPDVQHKVATLREVCGRPVDRTDLLIDILREFEPLFELLRSQPERLAEEADRVCLQKGRKVVLEVEQGLVSGQCLGIDPTGALVLKAPLGERRFLSGIVVAVE